jgi:hypothetical protein
VGIATLACIGFAATGCGGSDGEARANIEVIFVRDGESAARDVVAARCDFRPVVTDLHQARGRVYEGERTITEKMLTCLRDSPRWSASR